MIRLRHLPEKLCSDFFAFLEVHIVHLRKSAIIGTRIFSESDVAALCGAALNLYC